MTTEVSTRPLQTLLAFPFHEDRWQSKMLIGIGLTLAGMIIPIIPGLILMGYVYQIMHRVIVDRSNLYLPEWDNWGKFLKDGWRLFCVAFLYSLPTLVVSFAGMGIYIITFIGAMTAAGNHPDSPASILLVVAIGILFLSIGLSILTGTLTFLVLPAALGHTVARDSFSAGFDFTGWWKIFRANTGGFLIALLVITGLMGLVYIVSQIFSMTIVLICLIFLLPLAVGFYVMLIGAALVAGAYREGVENLELAELKLAEASIVAAQEEKPS